jgi:quercetin dioxygenase-like cupin family protein
VKDDEIKKGTPFTVTNTEYVPHSVVSKTILKKATGTVSVISVDSGKTLMERTSPFDNLVHVIEGTAEITIEGKSTILELGQAIIIPAHARSSMVASTRFKIVSTVIKSGYEDIT